MHPPDCVSSNHHSSPNRRGLGAGEAQLPGDSAQQGKVICFFILTDSPVNDNNHARRLRIAGETM